MFKIKPKIYKNYAEDWDSKEQIVFCENGVFKRVRTSSQSYLVKKTTAKKLGLVEDNIVFDKIGDTPIKLKEKPYLKKPIPKRIMDTILRFYQVYAKNSLEVKLNVWYDKITDEYFIDCPFQTNGSAHVTEHSFDHPAIIWTEELKTKYSEKFLLKEKKKAREIEKVLDTHSHHNMSCSFSGVDDNSDYFTSVGYHMSGVYKMVLKYPTLDLRYFVSPSGTARPLNHQTLQEDMVDFNPSDIFSCDSKENKSYDFNNFAKHIKIDTKELFGGEIDEI